MSDEPFKVEEPDLSGSYTARDYLSWQLDELVELIRGRVYRMSPAPTSNHQRILNNLNFELLKYFQGKKCEVFIAPFDVYLVKPGQDYRDAKNVVEPDLCVICNPDKIQKFGCVGSPDLAVEILSPSTSKKDRTEKLDLYEEYGVLEYWIVSPQERSVEMHVLENGRYIALPPAFDGEKITSRIFPELTVDLAEVFSRVEE